MLSIYAKKVVFFIIAAFIIAIITLTTGCLLQTPKVITDYFSNSLVIHVTVENNTSDARTVTLLPAYGQRKNTYYQWLTGTSSGGNASKTHTINANAKQVLTADIGKSGYDDFQIGNDILSFIIQIDNSQYAGWDAQYGNGNGTFVPQGYGYVIVGENNGHPGWHSTKCQPKVEINNTDGNPEWVTVEYTITITDNSVEFVLNTVAFGEAGNL
jgi:hypothetical protein